MGEEEKKDDPEKTVAEKTEAELQDEEEKQILADEDIK